MEGKNVSFNDVVWVYNLVVSEVRLYVVFLGERENKFYFCFKFFGLDILIFGD